MNYLRNGYNISRHFCVGRIERKTQKATENCGFKLGETKFSVINNSAVDCSISLKFRTYMYMGQ